jgi:hypothetical protein
MPASQEDHKLYSLTTTATGSSFTLLATVRPATSAPDLRAHRNRNRPTRSRAPAHAPSLSGPADADE